MVLEVGKDHLLLIFCRDGNTVVRVQRLDVVFPPASIYLGMEKLRVDIAQPDTRESCALVQLNLPEGKEAEIRKLKPAS